MRVNKRKGISKKRCLRTMGILLASVMVLSMGAGQLTYADQGDQKTESSEEKNEKLIVYLDGESGSDKRSGDSEENAVKTFKKAADLAGDYGVIRICGTVTIKGEETWELPNGVSVRRAEEFEDALIKVTGSLTLDNVRIYTEDITGDGEVEGAVEREKVYVPKKLVLDEPAPLSELPLSKCDGDGVFSWEDESLTPAEYETVYKVIFHPYDTKAVDYSEVKGWDEEEQIVVREITVQVTSLKPAETTPEATPEATPEVTPESTPEATPEATLFIT
ncbi:MAG: hypothetical protein EOM18_15775, partial [Clostridia bacterium]|nr:hypothetical protein [Clostridia bacterium]